MAWKMREMQKFHLDNEKYRRLVGSLLYIALNNRPDIAVSVSILAQKVVKLN